MKLTTYKLKKTLITTIGQQVFLYLLLGQVLLPGLVLCYGTDGKVALETDAQGLTCCASILVTIPQQVSHFLPVNGRYSDKGHCGKCTDIAISISNSEKNNITSKDIPSKINVSAIPTILFSLAVFVDNSNESSVQQNSSEVNSVLNSLQTTILIC